jgi:hypothetical protein
MPVWQIEFYPSSEEHNSPYDYIENLSNKADTSAIEHRLSNLAQRELADWPHTWVHKITDKIFQLTVRNHRLLYCLDGRKIVILHACRKVKAKTLKKDIQRAEINYDSYFSTMKGW